MIVKIHLETQIQILGIVWPIRCVGHVHELGAHMKGWGLLETLQWMNPLVFAESFPPNQMKP